MTRSQIPYLDLNYKLTDWPSKLTPRTEYAIYEYGNSSDDVSIVLNLEFYKKLNENQLGFYFAHITPHNKKIFLQTVDQGEKELAKKILKLLPELTNIMVMSTDVSIPQYNNDPTSTQEILDHLVFECDLTGEEFNKSTN